MSSQIEYVDKVRESYQQALNAHYENGPIYRKCQTLPAVCQLLEYFEADRFKTIGDAYNQYELEIRLDKIIYSIQDLGRMLSYQLDQLIDNQRELYDALSEVKNQVRAVDASINKCNETLQANLFAESMQTYYSAKTAEATQLLANIEYYEKRYSLPPALCGAGNALKMF